MTYSANDWLLLFSGILSFEVLHVASLSLSFTLFHG